MTQLTFFKTSSEVLHLLCRGHELLRGTFQRDVARLFGVVKTWGPMNTQKGINRTLIFDSLTNRLF